MNLTDGVIGIIHGLVPYFVTICTKDRACIFGEIVDRQMILSKCGIIVKNEMINIPNYHSQIQLGQWVIMPNHVHAIIEITNNDEDKIHEFYLPPYHPQDNRPWWYNPDYQPSIDEIKQYRKQRRKMIIPKTIGKFKMKTSKQMNIINNTPGKRNWQKDYHDRIIRNSTAYQNISNYIAKNPSKWKGDTFNPR